MMSTTLDSEHFSMDNSVCHLCRTTFGINEKCICEENSQMDEVYRITVKYFPAKFLEPTPVSLCVECWRHIIDFYSFQELVFAAQKHVVDAQDKKPFATSNLTIATISSETMDVKPNIKNINQVLQVKEEKNYADENCQNTGNTSANDQLEYGKILTLKNDDHFDISLSDLDDIDIEFSSDDEMIVSKKEILQKEIQGSTIKSSPRTSDQKSSSENDQAASNENKTLTTDDDIDEFVKQYKPKLVCWICRKSFKDFALLERHFSNSHTIGQCYIYCCQRKITNRYMLMDHILCKHVDGKETTCEICNIQYPRPSILKKHHMQKHCFPCPECPNVFKTKKLLDEHYNTHFVCSECNKGFLTADGLKSHTQMVHEGGKTNYAAPKPKKRCLAPFTCKECGKRMETKIFYDNHQRFAHDVNNKYKCNVCEKAFKKVLHFRDHMNSHTKCNYYACPHCPEMLQFWSRFESHLLNKHGEKCTAKQMKQILLAERNYILAL